MKTLTRLCISVGASVLALASAYALSEIVRTRAAVESHAVPTPEDWVLRPSPTSPQMIAQGRSQFLSSCAHCHGADATGDEGPDLHGLEASDRYLARTINLGIKGEMPAFRKKFAADDVTSLIAYLRTLDS